MGWLGDTLRVILGLDEEQRDYRQKLAGAERYLEWGRAGDGARDLAEALTLLAGCVPENAPGPHFAFRRERLLTEVNLLLAEAALAGLAAAIARVGEHILSAEEGRQAMKLQVETLRTRTAQLDTEGSLISAREEQRRIEELEREIRALPDLEEDRRSRLSAALARTEPDFRARREAAARSLAAMREAHGLGGEDRQLREKFAELFSSRLAALDERWKRAAAEGPRPAAKPPAAKPAASEMPAAPGESQGS